MLGMVDRIRLSPKGPKGTRKRGGPSRQGRSVGSTIENRDGSGVKECSTINDEVGRIGVGGKE